MTPPLPFNLPLQMTREELADRINDLSLRMAALGGYLDDAAPREAMADALAHVLLAESFYTGKPPKLCVGLVIEGESFGRIHAAGCCWRGA